MDHASFRERFGNGVNGRSTEISESSIDETPPVQRNNFRTIRSSCFGDLTDSPQTPSCSPLMAGGESSHAPKGLHDSSHNVVISPPASACPEPEERETPLKGKIGKRKRAAPKEPMAKKSSVTVEKNMSQSGARTLSLSNSDNYTTMNSTAVVDQAADTSTSSRDRPRRARKEVSYKEPPLAGKLRRN